jgi:hypothetical protein
MQHTCNEDPRTTKWMQKRRWVAVTCWDVEGMEDDISHVVAADDGVEARGSPHVVAVAWLRTFRRRRGCGVRLPLDRSGRATQIGDGYVVEESGAMGRSRVKDGSASLLCTDRGRRHDRVRGDGVASGRSWVEDGCTNLLCMDRGRLCDGG